MTRDDTKKMILYLRTAFKGFCEDANLTDVVNVWHDAFKDEDVHIVSQATRNYTKTSIYQPTIAGIQEQINLIKEPETDTELWDRITKAARNSAYGSVEEFNKLPEVCQHFLGSPAALKDIGQIDSGTLQTVVKGQFVKVAPRIREHQEVQKGLPMEVRQAIEASKMKMLMEGES